VRFASGDRRRRRVAGALGVGLGLAALAAATEWMLERTFVAPTALRGVAVLAPVTMQAERAFAPQGEPERVVPWLRVLEPSALYAGYLDPKGALVTMWPKRPADLAKVWAPGDYVFGHDGVLGAYAPATAGALGGVKLEGGPGEYLFFVAAAASGAELAGLGAAELLRLARAQRVPEAPRVRASANRVFVGP